MNFFGGNELTTGLTTRQKVATLLAKSFISKVPKALIFFGQRFRYYFVPRILIDTLKYCLPPIFQKKIKDQASKELSGLCCLFMIKLLALRGLNIIAPPHLGIILTRYFRFLAFSIQNRYEYPAVYRMSERSDCEINKKNIAYQKLIQSNRINRIPVYREIARLERLLGNEMTAIVYAIRAMRLAGSDIFHDGPWVCDALCRQGFSLEAEAVDAMYGRDHLRPQKCLQVFESAKKRASVPPPHCEFEIYEDRRGPGQVKVSVITSLYNASDKLGCFLQALQNQTLNRQGMIELILIDSNSPGNDYQVFSNLNLHFPIRSIYVRTAKRESIQTAWNRGIGLARAPFLTFLGVDETILPTTLEELSGLLDADPELDWVQADSLVTEVDENGLISRDVMKYDRTGYTPLHVHLETCYLSWVGALYRRSIHDRYGYYDGSFLAAGDTEFKSRVLPFLKTKHVPKTLGVFLNYPEERTTASPRAELEDLRAWYIHRTSTGIGQAFKNKSDSELEKMLVLSLHYRKSYCSHFSTDVEFAANVLEVLRARTSHSSFFKLEEGVKQLLEIYRTLDNLPPRKSKLTGFLQRKIREIKIMHQRTNLLPANDYYIFNDNRHEQHHWLWPQQENHRPSNEPMATNGFLANVPEKRLVA